MNQQSTSPNEELDSGILITAEEASMYRMFRRHNEKFGIMLGAGVLDFDYGMVEMNMHNTQIQNIILHRRAYKRDAK